MPPSNPCMLQKKSWMFGGVETAYRKLYKCPKIGNKTIQQLFKKRKKRFENEMVVVMGYQ